MENYYKILDINPLASFTDIKKAYRTLAVKYHPDKSKNEETTKLFITITEAYEVLKDSDKRKEYDILYRNIFEKKSTTTEQYKATEETWKAHGEFKAKQYASMGYEEFAKRAFDEILIAKKYTLNFAGIAFCIFAVFTTPTAFSIDPMLGIWCLILYSVLGTILYKRTAKDYKDDRAKKFNS
ncbi:J domain-containing protein [Flavobacterium sp. 140616W15]|uniref:J domain-containing protein n=1 Tax=Flavobacterium sp. 140616W15 TaxID=2478552 RepID=UPI000F0C3F0E|nr:J domain-containing protein [Flavobacterium sp. 140616W15]AYN05485.1 J domain-containing protein [Flavobacterium sp. 140616W15]